MDEHYNAVKTHCPKGHAYDAGNTRVTPEGWRNCRACDSEKHRERSHKRTKSLHKRRIRQAHSTSSEGTALLDKLRQHEQYRDRLTCINGTPGSRSGTIEALIRDACERLAITVTREEVEAVTRAASSPERVTDFERAHELAKAAFGGARFSG